ncbi:response regulator transcription factor [Fusibacter bizertensis]|uniref:Stage 0 sporulation protein A homolog n=1 Tax=Fusibacter bizertensis TaxID=1488331 RepID=A0ABT6NBW3_9FIRM|nr:response regulator transcription factor [Fusibacter bizertensis]MDH8677908.1 response regulator transcription factor [Fusibacter bizertensis]
MMVRVGIVDDQPLLLKGLGLIISAQRDMEVVWTANHGVEAVYKTEQIQPDVILMDIRMPEMNGVEATKHIKQAYPHVKVIILTTFMEDEEIYDSLKFGASGYLLKDATPETIIDAIIKAVSGGTIIEANVASKLVKHLTPKVTSHQDERISTLTHRELEIARAIASGLSNKEIAQQLFVSEGTVKNHLTNILLKLELRDRTQLAIYMVKNCNI